MSASGPSLLDVGRAFGFGVMMAVWLFLYVLAVMALGYLLYGILSIPAWVARRIRRGPEPRG